MKKRSNEYWKKRSIARMASSEKQSIAYLRNLQRIYKESLKATTKDLRDAYAAYYKKSDKTFDIPQLDNAATQGDIKRFLAAMRKAGLSTYLPENYSGRMSRLDMLEAQLWGEVKKAAIQEGSVTRSLYRDIYENSYYRTGYDYSKGTGMNLAFGTLDAQTMDAVMSQKFVGSDFSERIWNNTDRLAGELKEILGVAIATGQSEEKTIRLLRERFDVATKRAARLIRTETAYFHNRAELDAYEEMGFEKYQILGTLDMRCCDECQRFDSKVFNVKDRKYGENAPPFHPYCRCTEIAYFSKEFEPKTRIARDDETGRNYQIENMSYEKWRNSLENETSSSDREKIKVNVGTKAKTIGRMDSEKIMNYLENESGIEFQKVNKLSKKLTEKQIIDKVSGGDRTLGSCASAAFAYVGNKLGYDVLDFRGGKSQKFFSVNAKSIIEKIATIQEGLDGHKTGYALLNTMKPNKEYYFGIGKHAAIVRLNGELKKWQYLELQSPNDNGWKPFTKTTLKRRFGCPRFQTRNGLKMPARGYIAEVDAFKQIEGFSDIIGYINTANKKQLKGKAGRII